VCLECRADDSDAAAAEALLRGGCRSRCECVRARARSARLAKEQLALARHSSATNTRSRGKDKGGELAAGADGRGHRIVSHNISTGGGSEGLDVGVGDVTDRRVRDILDTVPPGAEFAKTVLRLGR
jgi:hypothetical protein